MNRDQKRRLALALLNQAGDLVEFFTDKCPDLADEITSAEAAEQLGRWLKHLPGDDWDTRLPEPGTTP